MISQAQMPFCPADFTCSAFCVLYLKFLFFSGIGFEFFQNREIGNPICHQYDAFIYFATLPCFTFKIIFTYKILYITFPLHLKILYALHIQFSCSLYFLIFDLINNSTWLTNNNQKHL